MASPSHTLDVFSMKTSSSSSTLSSIKIKTTLINTLVLSHVYRIARAISKAKTILIEILKDMHLIHFIQNNPLKTKTRKHKNMKIFFGSFRLHYNWGSNSSHVLPASDNLYYESTWNSSEQCEESQLSGYLHWLEEKGGHVGHECDAHEIDKLADMFIANCHEKFRLEKQESYRMFQEMMARSM